MALAVLGLIAGSTILIACGVILVRRLARAQRSPRLVGEPCGVTPDGGWLPATAGDGASDCSGGDGGGCDGGGGGD